MVHVPDLTPMEHRQLIAVGYLAQREPFSRGPIGTVFVGALLDLVWLLAFIAARFAGSLAARNGRAQRDRTTCTFSFQRSRHLCLLHKNLWTLQFLRLQNLKRTRDNG